MGIIKTSSNSLKETDKTIITVLSKSLEIPAFITNLVISEKLISQPVLVQPASKDRVEIYTLSNQHVLLEENTFRNNASKNKEHGLSSNLCISASTEWL